MSEKRPERIYGDPSLIAGRPWTSLLGWVVVLAAAGADVTTFYQVLILVLNEPVQLIWMAVLGFTAVALALAHYAGHQTKAALHPRHPTGAAFWAWFLTAAWVCVGVVAFVIRWLISPSSGSDSSTIQLADGQSVAPSGGADLASQHLTALLFLALYLATGAVAGVAGYQRPDPAARQWQRATAQKAKAVRRHARLRKPLRAIEMTAGSIEEARERVIRAWESAAQESEAQGRELTFWVRLDLLEYLNAASTPRDPVPPGPVRSEPETPLPRQRGRQERQEPSTRQPERPAPARSEEEQE